MDGSAYARIGEGIAGAFTFLIWYAAIASIIIGLEIIAGVGFLLYWLFS